MMIGFNSFYDHDMTEGHKRASIGFEASASTLEFNFNQYYALSGMQNVIKENSADSVEEQAVGGLDYRLASQLPYMPWAEIGWTGYQIEADKGAENVKGDIYSLGLALTPSLQLDLRKDQSNSGEDTKGGSLSFIYPPRESEPTLVDGFTSDEIWFEESMQNKLSQKVERNNNLTVEIQGSVIITSK
jgi:adhesin/invasin